jgi:hypothetical protein
MQINRHNYEEFFLLYVDNELSAAERKTVELFVQENADLKAELNMLQQTVFNADEVVFENKNSLLKEEVTAMQENLLLYIDDELSTADKLNVEQLLKADTHANKELALLQQTKLKADTAIVFANKKSLYRKEGGRIIELPWRRIAAAAILLGFGTWATISFINTKTPAEGVNVANNQSKAATPKQTVNTAPVTTLPQQPSTVNDVNPTVAKVGDAVKSSVVKNSQQANNKLQQSVSEKQNDSIIVAKEELKRPTNNLPQPYKNFNNNNSNERLYSDVTPKNAATDKINSGLTNSVVVANNITNNSDVSGYALHANYTDDNADNNLSTDDNKGRKTKLGGFIRKVKRLVERTTEDPSGKGIKVAGFDIAIK